MPEWTEQGLWVAQCCELGVLTGFSLLLPPNKLLWKVRTSLLIIFITIPQISLPAPSVTGSPSVFILCDTSVLLSHLHR